MQGGGREIILCAKTKKKGGEMSRKIGPGGLRPRGGGEPRTGKVEGE